MSGWMWVGFSRRQGWQGWVAGVSNWPNCINSNPPMPRHPRIHFPRLLYHLIARGKPEGLSGTGGLRGIPEIVPDNSPATPLLPLCLCADAQSLPLVGGGGGESDEPHYAGAANEVNRNSGQIYFPPGRVHAASGPRERPPGGRSRSILKVSSLECESGPSEGVNHVREVKQV